MNVVSNSAGVLQTTVYDAFDRATVISNRPGPVLSQSFDLLGRVLSRSAVGGGTESMGYSARGLTRHTNQVGHVTQTDLDELGRVLTTTNAKGEVTHRTYLPGGELHSVTDPENQTTTWNYDSEGRMTNTVDATGTVIGRLTYDANGHILTRWSPAKGTTSYTFDAAGNLRTIDYPNSPDITLTYDPMNRLTSVSDPVTGTNSLAYTSFGSLLSEDGPWPSDTITNSYDANVLRSRIDLLQPVGGNWTVTYTYDAVQRLKTIGMLTGTFTNGYEQASSLLNLINLPNGGSIAKSYDALGRLSVSQLRDRNLSVLDYQGDTLDNADRLTRRTRLSNYVDYDYDQAEQLASAYGYETSGGAQRRHEWLTYNYDSAGNLTHRTRDGLIEDFGVNNLLNELSTATTSGTVTVSGMTQGGATNVTVSGTAVVPFADGTFAVSGLALASAYTATAQSGSSQVSDSVSGIASSPVTFVYDGNGNLTGDGKRLFTYDDENRLTRVQVTGAWRTDFAYDGLGRRRWRKEYDGNGTPLREVRYVYDGKLVIQEPDGNNAVLVTYTRGWDLSGSAEGAGGIAGLLARTDSSGTTYYHTDSGGNVTAVVNRSHFLVAQYVYDPFGGIVGKIGGLADANAHRFSSKEFHEKSGLIYFGARFYDPSLQRWLNRDPIGIEGGVNLYGFVRNDPANSIDPNGQNLYKEIFRLLPIRIPIPGPFGWAYLGGWAGAILIDKGTDLLYPDPGSDPLSIVDYMAKKADIQFIDYLQKKYNLTNDDRERLHELISGQNYSRSEIEEIAKGMARRKK